MLIICFIKNNVIASTFLSFLFFQLNNCLNNVIFFLRFLLYWKLYWKSCFDGSDIFTYGTFYHFGSGILISDIFTSDTFSYVIFTSDIFTSDTFSYVIFTSDIFTSDTFSYVIFTSGIFTAHFPDTSCRKGFNSFPNNKF